MGLARKQEEVSLYQATGTNACTGTFRRNSSQDRAKGGTFGHILRRV